MSWEWGILILLALIVVFAIAILLDERNHSKRYPHPKNDEGRYGHIHFHSHGEQ